MTLDYCNSVKIAQQRPFGHTSVLISYVGSSACSQETV